MYCSVIKVVVYSEISVICCAGILHLLQLIMFLILHFCYIFSFYLPKMFLLQARTVRSVGGLSWLQPCSWRKISIVRKTLRHPLIRYIYNVVIQAGCRAGHTRQLTRQRDHVSRPKNCCSLHPSYFRCGNSISTPSARPYNVFYCCHRNVNTLSRCRESKILSSAQLADLILLAPLDGVHEVVSQGLQLVESHPRHHILP